MLYLLLKNEYLIKLWKVKKNENKKNKKFFFCFIDLENRDKRTNEIVHVINIDVIDNPEDATLGAFMLCELGQKVKHSKSTLTTFLVFLFFIDGNNK
jgi:hypothetical protein